MKYRKPGFTLIEVLVAMSMIIILSGVFLPKYLGYKEKSIKAKGIFTGRELQGVAMSSFSQSGSFIPMDILELTQKTTDVKLVIGNINVDKSNINIVTINYVSDDIIYCLYIDVSKGFKILNKDKVIYDKMEPT